MKKQLFIALCMLLPLSVTAQHEDWEIPDEVEQKKVETTTTTPEPVKPNPDQKYLAGAVPEVNGKVVFQTTIAAPGKSADEIFDKVLSLTQRMTQTANQMEESRVVVQDRGKHQVVGDFQEWLVFTDKALVLDRTRLRYYLIIDCKDGEATVRMTRINYLYDEERDPQRYTAEEWITDKEALNKKGDGLYHMNGKFRRKTIDRKDFIFSKFEETLK